MDMSTTWCRFRVNDKTSYGIVEDDTVVEVSGSPFGEHEITSTRHPLSGVKLLVPVTPPTFYAAGINYPEHITWAAQRVGTQPNIPKQADVGYRAVNALTAHETNIIMPRDSSEELQYEGELVAVIGKKAKNLSKEEALSCVLGYTIGNDVSQRTWQRGDRTLWRAKNSDTFKPMGPWIVTDLDPTNLETTIRLNGKVLSQFNTGTMVFDTATYISEMSKYLTLYPGDILWMGTEGETENMKPGDTIEVEIGSIGTLRNYVVAEE
jgi:2-keto-4-pentenoate hydratase/2-oxohepta-3-ene-1,7-dioic acid hydratase in catechol pathway